jgi:putative spermidine/putrescine transport system permease protein
MSSLAPVKHTRAFIRAKRSSGVALAMPALALLSCLFFLPVIVLLSRSFLEPEPGFQNYIELLNSSSYRAILLNTFTVSTVVTLVTLAIGFPLAWLLVIVPRAWAAAIFSVLILSMWTNLLTRTFAWMILLQSTGVINRGLLALGLIDSPLPLTNNLLGLTIGMTYIMLPFIVFPLYATMCAVDPALLRAASLCGASRIQCFFYVFLPQCTSGIAAGCLMVFVMSLGYFVTPALLGGPSYMMVAELIVQLIQSMLNWGMGAAAAFILFAVTLLLYGLQIRFFDPLSHSGKE